MSASDSTPVASLPGPVSRPAPAAWPGYLTAGWGLAFGAAHFYWALGGRALLDAGADDGMNGWFLAYDLVAGVLCLVGAYVALALVRERRAVVPHRALVRLAWIGGAVLLLRGGIGAIQLAYWAFSGAGDPWDPMSLYEPWFLLGGLLFIALARGHPRRPVA